MLVDIFGEQAAEQEAAVVRQPGVPEPDVGSAMFPQHA
jgi:hypothetical protein